MAADVAGADRSHSTMPNGIPNQFLARAVAIVVGLTLLLLVGVHGAAFYGAWGLIALAFLSEVLATLVYWQRGRGAQRPLESEPD
jgi:O-antigen/teichoic acid export membrane protein